LQKSLFIFLLAYSLAASANPLVDALKGKKPQIESVGKRSCEHDISDAIEKNNPSFFKTSKEDLKSINDCLIDNDLTPLMAASYSDKTAIVKQFLSAGVDVNEKNPRAYTALHFAVFYGNYEIASLLLDAGAFVDARNNIGQTPLMIAAYYGNTKTVKLLLSRKADSFITDNAGLSALDLALKKGKKEIVKLLKTNK